MVIFFLLPFLSKLKGPVRPSNEECALNQLISLKVLAIYQFEQSIYSYIWFISFELIDYEVAQQPFVGGVQVEGTVGALLFVYVDFRLSQGHIVHPKKTIHVCTYD